MHNDYDGKIPCRYIGINLNFIMDQKGTRVNKRSEPMGDFTENSYCTKVDLYLQITYFRLYDVFASQKES